MATTTLIASDSFQRANSGTLGSNWTPMSGLTSSQIVSNSAEATALSTDNEQFWSANSFPNDQISEVTLGASFVAQTGTQFSLNVRYNAGANSGYRAAVASGTTLTIYKVTAGVLTSLTTASVTPAAGDIWAMCVCGSLIIVYRNGVLVAFTSDTTYTSGNPGFSQFTTVNVANCQIASWRGYNVVQQDGIWNKRGAVVPALAGDYPGTRPQGQSNPTILYEGNSQLGFSGNVFKMWFLGGTGVGYAESQDGLMWTRRFSNVITGTGQTPSVIKNGSTYHLYCVPVAGGTVAHYTSSDGISWTLQSSNVHAACYYFSPVYIDAGGTWHALFTASGTPNTTNLSTSPDGITWTDYVGNPVVSNFWGIVKVFQINGVFYAWGQTANVGQGSSIPGTDPGEGLRMQTTDFIHWTNPVHSAHHSQMFENVNGIIGGNYVSFPIDTPSGQAVLYSSVEPQDTIGGNGGMFVITAAVGPTSIAGILTQSESALQQTATDSFQRANENPLSGGGVWAAQSGQGNLQLVGGVVEPVSNTSSAMVYTGAGFSNDQFSSVTIGTLGTGGLVFPTVRANVGATTFYFGLITGPTGTLGTASIAFRVNGVGSQIGPSVNCKPQVGDVFTLSVVGNVISLYQNGFLLLQVSDSQITSGNPGIGENPQSATLSNSQITTWAGGNANVIPSFAYSVPDSRTITAITPNSSRLIQGTLTYDVPKVDSRASGAPTDSRASGAPTDSRASGLAPQNSRTPGTYGPGVN